MKHTTGNWIVRDNRKDGGYLEIETTEGNYIGMVDSDGIEDKEEVRANAKLIASAPELLETLVLLTSKLKRGDTEYKVEHEQALIAIQKAIV